MEANGRLEDIINWEDCKASASGCKQAGRDGRRAATGVWSWPSSAQHWYASALLFVGFFYAATLLNVGFKQPLKAFADLHNTAVDH